MTAAVCRMFRFFLKLALQLHYRSVANGCILEVKTVPSTVSALDIRSSFMLAIKEILLQLAGFVLVLSPTEAQILPT